MSNRRTCHNKSQANEQSLAWLCIFISVRKGKENGNQTLISTSTPEGNSSFIRASTVLLVAE